MAKASKVESGSKLERIAAMKKELEKQFGKGALIGAKDKPKSYDCISTGSLGLDKALGIGGLARGRIIEMMGWESSGKTTVATHVIAEAHKKDPDSQCAFIDAEHAFDTGYAESIGVDLERLQINQCDYGEQGLEIASKIISSGDFDVVVIDSVAALVPKSELDGEMGDTQMGKHARLMSQALRKIAAITEKSNTLVIFINQLREKIGVMFGDNSTTTGGNALKFYASVRLEVSRSTTVANSQMVGDEKMGNLTKVKVIKNKLAPPFKKCEFFIKYGQGIDKYDELIEAATDSGVFTKSGSWFAYNGDNIAQGKVALDALLRDNEELFEEVKLRVRESFVPKDFEPTPAEQIEATQEVLEETS